MNPHLSDECHVRSGRVRQERGESFRDVQTFLGIKAFLKGFNPNTFVAVNVSDNLDLACTPSVI